ncbi:MAG: hypothetical protein AAGF12_29235 [Myxococcota bacterium]
MFQRIKNSSLAAFIFAALSFPVAATAQEPQTDLLRFGVGLEGSIAPNPTIQVGDEDIALPGLSFIYRYSRSFSTQVLIGVGWSRNRTDRPAETETSITALQAGLRAHFVPVVYGPFRLGLVVGALFRGRFGGSDAAMLTNNENRRGFSAEAGLRPEWFVVDHLSLHTQLGVAFVFEDSTAGTEDLALLVGANLLTQAGATVWF